MVRFQSIKRKFPFSSLFPPCPQGVAALSGSTINSAPSMEHDDHAGHNTSGRAQQQAGRASRNTQDTQALLLLFQLGIHAHTSPRTFQHSQFKAVPRLLCQQCQGHHECHQAIPSCSQHPTALPQRLPFPTK